MFYLHENFLESKNKNKTEFLEKKSKENAIRKKKVWKPKYFLN